MGLTKPFEAPQRSVKRKISVNFFTSFGIATGRVNTMKPNYRDFHCNWTIVIFAWFVEFLWTFLTLKPLATISQNGHVVTFFYCSAKSQNKKKTFIFISLWKRGIFLRAVRSHPTHPFSYATVRTSMFALVLILKKSNPLVTGVH